MVSPGCSNLPTLLLLTCVALAAETMRHGQVGSGEGTIESAQTHAQVGALGGSREKSLAPMLGVSNSDSNWILPHTCHSLV